MAVFMTWIDDNVRIKILLAFLIIAILFFLIQALEYEGLHKDILRVFSSMFEG